VNRLDGIVTYQPLGSEALGSILDMQIAELQEHIDKRLGQSTFHLEVPQRTRKFLLEKGTSVQYGARELKRTLQRQLIQPLSSLIAGGEVEPGAHVRAELSSRKDKLVMRDVGAEVLSRAG
jgi:ATP-dependent Clp protease ATP-binding subunit ClpA